MRFGRCLLSDQAVGHSSHARLHPLRLMTCMWPEISQWQLREYWWYSILTRWFALYVRRGDVMCLIRSSVSVSVGVAFPIVSFAARGGLYSRFIGLHWGCRATRRIYCNVRVERRTAFLVFQGYLLPSTACCRKTTHLGTWAGAERYLPCKICWELDNTYS
ncbi:hypothetical protein GGR57DRAFT_451070 [Xylariaceae sp. FL1272]|nr:hypothetical protein GGR57DRAFT_451070 [Xylariaceae sp. FL1272]